MNTEGIIKVLSEIGNVSIREPNDRLAGWTILDVLDSEGNYLIGFAKSDKVDLSERELRRKIDESIRFFTEKVSLDVVDWGFFKGYGKLGLS